MSSLYNTREKRQIKPPSIYSDVSKLITKPKNKSQTQAKNKSQAQAKNKSQTQAKNKSQTQVKNKSQTNLKKNQTQAQAKNKSSQPTIKYQSQTQAKNKSSQPPIKYQSRPQQQIDDGNKSGLAFEKFWNKFPPTEMQHDFGNKGKNYKGKKEKSAEETANDAPIGLIAEYINTTPLFNSNKKILSSTLSNKDKLEALTDPKMIEEIFGVNKDLYFDPPNSTYENNKKIYKDGKQYTEKNYEFIENIKSKINTNGLPETKTKKRIWTRENEAGVKQTWEIMYLELIFPGDKKSEEDEDNESESGKKGKKEKKGKKGGETNKKVSLAEEFIYSLQIPNNSVAVVDCEGRVISALKSGGPTGFTLFYCENNITRADSAKKKPSFSPVFSGVNGAMIKLIINTDTILVQGNNELKMNYNVTNSYNGEGDNSLPIIKQEWNSLTPNLNSFTIERANIENNISSVKPPIRSLKNAIDAKKGLNDKIVEDGLTALIRKRSGDQFQAWITKYLIRDNAKKNDINKYNVIYNFQDNVTKKYYQSKQDSIDLATLLTSNELGDIFTVTGDYIYLCFCIECLGVSVLFSPKKGSEPYNKFIYYRRVN